MVKAGIDTGKTLAPEQMLRNRFMHSALRASGRPVIGTGLFEP